MNNVFLHGDLIKKVYMKVSQGYAKLSNNRVFRLQKSLYGLKQVSRKWYKNFTDCLLSFGFNQLVADNSLFTYIQGNSFTTILVYVDDIMIIENDSSFIDHVKQHLDVTFNIKDLGHLKYFLGIEVT